MPSTASTSGEDRIHLSYSPSAEPVRRRDAARRRGAEFGSRWSVSDLKVSPITELYPLMDDSDLAELVDSIRRNGVHGDTSC